MTDMKKLFLMAAVLGSFTLTSNALMAESHSGERKGDHKGKMMERVDTNADGEISKAELMAMHETKFTKIDANGDGSISKEEMKNAHKNRMGKRKERKEKRMSAE